MWTSQFVIYTSFSLRKGVTCHMLYHTLLKRTSSLWWKSFSNPAVLAMLVNSVGITENSMKLVDLNKSVIFSKTQ